MLHRIERRDLPGDNTHLWAEAGIDGGDRFGFDIDCHVGQPGHADHPIFCLVSAVDIEEWHGRFRSDRPPPT